MSGLSFQSGIDGAAVFASILEIAFLRTSELAFA